MKKIVRLTESDIHKIVKESVNQVIKEVLDTTDSIKQFYNDKGEQLNSPQSKIKGILNPKWKERKNRQMGVLKDKYDDIKLIDRHLNNMDNGHTIDDGDTESWLDQESETYPGFTNRQLRDLKDMGFGREYEEMYYA
jgi:hypothetical protein